MPEHGKPALQHELAEGQIYKWIQTIRSDPIHLKYRRHPLPVPLCDSPKLKLRHCLLFPLAWAASLVKKHGAICEESGENLWRKRVRAASSLSSSASDWHLRSWLECTVSGCRANAVFIMTP